MNVCQSIKVANLVLKIYAYRMGTKGINYGVRSHKRDRKIKF